MSRLLKVDDQIEIIKGEHAGKMGWIQSIEVELSSDIKTQVLFNIDIGDGETTLALISMIKPYSRRLRLNF